MHLQTTFAHKNQPIWQPSQGLKGYPLISRKSTYRSYFLNSTVTYIQENRILQSLNVRSLINDLILNPLCLVGYFIQSLKIPTRSPQAQWKTLSVTRVIWLPHRTSAHNFQKYSVTLSSAITEQFIKNRENEQFFREDCSQFWVKHIPTIA